MKTATGNLPTVLNEPAFSIMGHEVIVKLRTNSSNNYVFEMISPVSAGIALHKHADEDEVMYVLEGEMEITLGDNTFMATAGDCFSFPRHVPHGYTNIGITEARTLWIATPGNNLEQCFNELSTYTLEESADPQKIGTLAAKHNMQFC